MTGKNVSQLIYRLFISICFVMTLNACGKDPAIALPADKQDLLGVWQAKQSEFDNDVTSDNMLLVFHRDNSVSYVRCIDRLNGHNYTRMPNAKLIHIDDREFEIAIDLFISDISKRFTINKLPFQHDDNWWLIVNEVTLRKLREGEKSDYQSWQCNREKNTENNRAIDF